MAYLSDTYSDLTTRSHEVLHKSPRLEPELHSHLRFEQHWHTDGSSRGDAKKPLFEYVSKPPEEAFNIQESGQNVSQTSARKGKEWWWWEISGISLSICSTAAIIIILATANNKPLSDWRWTINPNALLNIFTTISRSTMLYAIAACLGQLKWLYFQNLPRQLSDLELFDYASRGPLGSTELILHGCLTRRAVVAALASFLTIASFAMGPFTQQALFFPSIDIRIEAEAAQIGIANIYEGYFFDSENTPMQGAIFNGLYSLNTPLSFSCATGRCWWQPFTSLGVCGQCSDVTAETETVCWEVNEVLESIWRCNYTTPDGAVLTVQTSTELSLGEDNGTTRLVARPQWRYYNSAFSRTDAGPNGEFAVFAAIKILEELDDEQAVKQGQVHECVLNWCAKTYYDVKVENGTLSIGAIHDIGLRYSHLLNLTDGRLGYYKWFHVFEVSHEEGESFPGNGTMFVGVSIDATIKDALRSLFNITLVRKYGGGYFHTDEAIGTVFHEQGVERAVEGIAASMTDRIRTSAHADVAYGETLKQEVHIAVRWPWLILPLSLELMAVLVLVMTIYRNAVGRMPLWKSSSLALLYHTLSGYSQDDLRVVGRSDGELAKGAKRMRVQLGMGYDGDYGFRRA